MAEIPQCYVKDKPVNYEGEILAMLGEGVRVGTYHFRPPSLGVWALWEILDSPIIHGSDDATEGDFFRLLWINEVRKDALPVIAEWVECGKPKVGEVNVLDSEVLDWASGLPEEILLDSVHAEILSQLPLCFTGYETLPKVEGNSGPWLFAGEAFGAVCGADGRDNDALIWDTPMTLHGHITAYRSKMNGEKAVARPKDEEDIVAQLKEANEREKRGKLHPWQIADPLGCLGTNLSLSAEQSKHAECVDRWERLLSEAKEKKK